MRGSPLRRRACRRCPQTLKNAGGPVDFLLLDSWIPLVRPVIDVMAPQLRPGAIVVCDNVQRYEHEYADYTAFVRDPKNGFRSVLLSHEGGLEISVNSQLKLKQQRSQERRRKIVAAATRLFGRRGIAQTSLTDIARLAGVPLPSLYDYFKDKRALVAAVPEENYVALYRAARPTRGRPIRAGSCARPTPATSNTFAPIPTGDGCSSSRSGPARRSARRASGAPSTATDCATSN